MRFEKGENIRMTDEKYNGWANWDTWETALIIDNSQSSYNWKHAWRKNLLKKKLKGKYDEQQAMKVVDKYIIPTARGKSAHARHFNMMENGQFATDPEINPAKVNKKEILKWLLEDS